MTAITLQPKTPEQLRLIKQLAKTQDIETSVVKETSKQLKKRELLQSLERSVDEMNAYLKGEIQMKSADDFLNEL